MTNWDTEINLPRFAGFRPMLETRLHKILMINIKIRKNNKVGKLAWFPVMSVSVKKTLHNENYEKWKLPKQLIEKNWTISMTKKKSSEHTFVNKPTLDRKLSTK